MESKESFRQQQEHEFEVIQVSKKNASFNNICEEAKIH